MTITNSNHSDTLPRPHHTKLSETIMWQGIEISITYKPNPFNLSSESVIAHFEIKALSPIGTQLPITETGYRSHYLHPDCVGEFDSPINYVCAWLDHEAKKPQWQTYLASMHQMNLFE